MQSEDWRQCGLLRDSKRQMMFIGTPVKTLNLAFFVKIIHRNRWYTQHQNLNTDISLEACISIQAHFLSFKLSINSKSSELDDV